MTSKRLSSCCAVAACALLLGSAGNAAAQAGAGTAPVKATRQNQGMASRTGPSMRLHQPAMLVFMLPELQPDLGLSSAEASKLAQMRDNLVNQEQADAKDLADYRQQLNAAYASGKADDSKVKSLLNKIADLEAQRQFMAYKTAEEMKSTLTEGQRSQLQSMNGRQMHNAMSRMTVGDMSRMMEFMRGSGMDMMGSDMMGPHGGMMNGNGGMMNDNGGMMNGNGGMMNGGMMGRHGADRQTKGNPQK